MLPIIKILGLSVGAYIVYALSKQKPTTIAAPIKDNSILTINSKELENMANQIYQFTKYGNADNFLKIKEILKKCNTNADINTLINFFGVKQFYLYGIPLYSKDLFGILKTLGENNVFKSEIETINANWAKKGITIKI
jgi:hypothetical protein